MAIFDEQKQKERLEEFHKKEEEDLVSILAGRYGLPYLDLSGIAINGDALKLVPEETAREVGLAPFQVTGKKLKVAILSPKNDKVKAIVDDMTRKGYLVTLYMSSRGSLEKAWKVYKEVSFATKTEAGVFDVSSDEINSLLSEVTGMDDLNRFINEITTGGKSHKISRMLEIILAGSIALSASDIHIEPEEKRTRLRFRLDGVLQDLSFLNEETYKFLLSRIKLLSGLKLNVKDISQDGRFSIKISAGKLAKEDGKAVEVEIRTSIIPGNYGESIVLRVLNPETISVSFENLGIEEKLFKILEKEIKRPEGLILTTGPTGSGKTTTLYAFLRKIYDPGSKIITIEDPIEYHLGGITQTQVSRDKGYTFLEGLRSAMRQDPDIIMVGEIRDEETASTAIQAALTGHLVFSTLHTNSAAGVIPRLIDLKVNPKIISSALKVSLAQRLVRKLCDSCKVADTLTENERGLIGKVLEGARADVKERYGNLENAKIWRVGGKTAEGGLGCSKCHHTGYRGRIGVFEGILTDENIEKVSIINPSEREVKKAALGQGILSLKEDGIVKVLSGITTLEEVDRVVDLDAE